ncbi:MAG: molybdopterin oxidoreductase family protein [Holophaga sp.]|jgi:anaerobic selenocysteine-containing dehydrogenase
MTLSSHRSACPFDCPDTCGLLVEVEDGRAVAVKGDPEHPHSRGTLCPKMTRYQDSVHSPLRLTTPLLAAGPKGGGRFVPISWDEAVARIAERWRAIIGEHGAQAILPYSYAGTMGLVQRNAGHPFFHRLGASRLDRTICTPAKAAGWEAVMGKTPALPPDTVLGSDLVLLWGCNALATSLHFLNRAREARRNGARVWLIDTFETPTAGLCDRTFLVRPGSDGALALGLMHLLVRDERHDPAFLAAQAQGFPELAAQVLPGFPPERVAELTGLAQADLEELAEAYGKARAPFILVGGGLSRYGNGAMTIRSIACLPAVAGAWAREGGGAFAGVNNGGDFPLGQVTREDFLPGPVRTVNMNLLGHALERLDGPRIMGLYVYNSNPAAVAPDQNAVLRGLARTDLFTVVHERFLTDTARYADLVLPATSSLEHSDLYRSYGSWCVQRARPAIPPVGKSRSNWDVFRLLAQAIGFTEPFFRQSADDLIDHLLASPSPVRAGLDRAALEAGRAVELRPAPGGWHTPSGRIEILNPALDPPLPGWFPRHAEADPLPFSLMTAPALLGLNSTFQERDALRERRGGMRLQMSPADAAAKGLRDGQEVVAFNALGEVRFLLSVTAKVPPGVVVAEGVWWQTFAPGDRTVNALTSQRLTDMGGGSTFYDNQVDVRGA